jgi:hypothetical protein
MIYELIKTVDPQTEGQENKVIVLEVDDLIPFNKQTNEFKDLFKSIAQDNMAEFDNANVVLFPESGRVIISKNDGDGI